MLENLVERNIDRRTGLDKSGEIPYTGWPKNSGSFVNLYNGCPYGKRIIDFRGTELVIINLQAAYFLF